MSDTSSNQPQGEQHEFELIQPQATYDSGSPYPVQGGYPNPSQQPYTYPQPTYGTQPQGYGMPPQANGGGLLAFAFVLRMLRRFLPVIILLAVVSGCTLMMFSIASPGTDESGTGSDVIEKAQSIEWDDSVTDRDLTVLESIRPSLELAYKHAMRESDNEGMLPVDEYMKAIQESKSWSSDESIALGWGTPATSAINPQTWVHIAEDGLDYAERKHEGQWRVLDFEYPFADGEWKSKDVADDWSTARVHLMRESDGMTIMASVSGWFSSEPDVYDDYDEVMKVFSQNSKLSHEIASMEEFSGASVICSKSERLTITAIRPSAGWEDGSVPVDLTNTKTLTSLMSTIRKSHPETDNLYLLDLDSDVVTLTHDRYSHTSEDDKTIEFPMPLDKACGIVMSGSTANYPYSLGGTRKIASAYASFSEDDEDAEISASYYGSHYGDPLDNEEGKSYEEREWEPSQATEMEESLGFAFKVPAQILGHDLGGYKTSGVQRDVLRAEASYKIRASISGLPPFGNLSISKQRTIYDNDSNGIRQTLGDEQQIIRELPDGTEVVLYVMTSGYKQVEAHWERLSRFDDGTYARFAYTLSSFAGSDEPFVADNIDELLGIIATIE